MLGISQTLLAKRMHDDSDKLSFPGFSGEKKDQDNRILIAIPALVFEMDVKELVDSNNIFVSTVTQLARIKKKEITDNGLLFDYISKKTGLSRELVKSILKEEEINQDNVTGEDNRIPHHSISRIVYNPISGTFYPNSVSSHTYDISTKVATVIFGEDGIELEFRLQEAQRWQSAYILHTDSYDEDKTLRNPTILLDKTPGLRQRLFHSKVGKNDVYYTGQCQLVYALCYCYLSKNDLTTLHLSNPIGHSDIDAMFPAIMDMMRKYPTENEELLNKIEELDAYRKEQLDKAGDWDQHLAEQEKEIRALYPDLANHASLLNRVSELSQSMHDSDRSKVVIAFHEFMEEILLYCSQNNVPGGQQWRAYNDRCKLLDSDGDKVDLLVGLAEEAGFISNDKERHIAAKCFAIRRPKQDKKAAKSVPISDFETDTSIVGVTYRNEGANTESRQSIIHDLFLKGMLGIGKALTLEADPTNPFDFNAIKVIGPDGRQLGMLPSQVAAIVSSRLKNGENYHAIITNVKGGNGFNYGIDIHIKGAPLPQVKETPKNNSKLGYIRYQQLQNLLKGSGSSSCNLPEILAANIVQAAVSPNHPFRKLSTSCHDIIASVYYSMYYRNHTKHDDDNQGTFEAHVSQDVMERTMDELLAQVMNIQKLSGEALEHERNLRAGRQRAQVESSKEMELYPSLRAFKDGGPLERVCTAFFFRESQYFSVCSNLLDKLLSEILSEQTDLEQRKQISRSFFSGDRNADAVKMEQLFAEVGCEYKTQDRPNTGKIKASWNSRNLSLKNKLFLCFATLYRYNRSYLDSIIQITPEIAKVTDKVCVLRGHNNVADFNASKDGYKELHRQLLACCENLCKLVSVT